MWLPKCLADVCFYCGNQLFLLHQIRYESKGLRTDVLFCYGYWAFVSYKILHIYFNNKPFFVLKL